MAAPFHQISAACHNAEPPMISPRRDAGAPFYAEDGRRNIVFKVERHVRTERHNKYRINATEDVAGSPFLMPRHYAA